MNYFKRDFSEPESVTLTPTLKKVSQRKRAWTISYRAIAPVAMAVDAIIILAAGIISGVLYHLEFVKSAGNIQQFAGFAAVVAALFISLAKSRNLYMLPELLNFKSQAYRLTIKWGAVFAFLLAVGFAMKAGDSFSRGATITFAAVGLAALIAIRLVWRIYLADGLAVRKFSSRKIALITEHSSFGDLVEILAQHGLQPARQFVLPIEKSDLKRRKEIIAQAIKSIRGSDVEEIVVGCTLDRWEKLSHLLAELRVLPLPVNLMPVGPVAELFKLSSHTIGDSVTIELQHTPRTWSQRFAKRSVDTICTLSAFVAFLPLILIAAIAVKLDSPGPVLFRQWRRGFNGRPFQIFKFRTMSVQEDGDAVVAVQRNDHRVTRVGNWLRRTSIDELPQLLNVLQGTMSLVGPRPHALAHDNEFERLLDNYAYRNHVKPGLTGWAQVNGYRGEMRTISDTEERVKYDLWYIDNWSLATDIRIMCMTVSELINAKNAY